MTDRLLLGLRRTSRIAASPTPTLHSCRSTPQRPRLATYALPSCIGDACTGETGNRGTHKNPLSQPARTCLRSVPSGAAAGNLASSYIRARRNL